MGLFNKAVCLAVGCVSVVQNTTNAGLKSKITFPTDVTCGEVNVFYTGLAAYHPLVISQGFDPARVDILLRNDTAKLVKAGFNVYILFQGPEQPASNIADRMEGRRWGVAGVGWGIRGSTIVELTNRFEESINQYREAAPLAPLVFNWSPTSLAESVIRHVPLREDCANRPGKLYAYEEICPAQLCEKVTVITSGSLDELLQGVSIPTTDGVSSSQDAKQKNGEPEL
ncbi:hypothetical protein F5883DRAFT_720193 [Diaporthe sp. PMI_573]|nr:hypothetical protein F5883DRAFT_720193 [Diaporthaceae sp. PMI_573]